MIETNDIYRKVDKEIVNKNFWELNLSKQKKLIEFELFNYTINKLIEIYPTNKMEKLSPDSLIVDILTYANSKLEDAEEKEEFFKNYTHYILNVAGVLQGMEITWCPKNDDTLIENPLIKPDEFGRWDELRTSINDEPLKTTLFVYYKFKNEFKLMNAKNKQKLLTIQ